MASADKKKILLFNIKYTSEFMKRQQVIKRQNISENYLIALIIIFFCSSAVNFLFHFIAYFKIIIHAVSY